MSSDERPARQAATRPRWPRAFVAVVDAAILVLLLAALAIQVTGGFRGEIAGVRVTARGAERPLLAALVLLVLRRPLARGRGAFGSTPETTRRVTRRLFDRQADDAPQARSASRGRALAAAALGIGAAGALLLRQQLRHMDAVPDLGDPLFSMWRMGWVFRQLAGDPRPLFDANIFHPEPLTLTLSDSMLLPALTAAPLLAASVPPVVAYNVLLLSGFLFSGVAAYLLIVRVTGSAPAAFVGGLLYGFYPFRFEHYSHLELQMTHWMPLALLALHRFVDTRRARDVVLAALCMVAQLYSSMYYGVFFPIYAAVVLGTLHVATRQPARRLIGPLAAGAVLAVVLAVPLARPYMAAQGIKGERHPSEVRAYSATFADYFRAHPRSAIYGGHLLPAEHGERALFPGITPVALAVAGLAPPVGTMRLAYVAGLLVAYDMSTGLNGLLYPHLYEWVLPIRGMRVPARFSIILAISLTMLASFGVRRLLARCRSARARVALTAALTVTVVADLAPVLRLQPVWSSSPPIYEPIARRPDVVLAEFPFAIDGTIDSLPQMYFSIWHGRSMVNGYSGFFPSGYQPLLDELEGFPAPAALAALRERGVTHVTVTCALMASGCAELLQAIRASGAFREVAAGEWEGQPARLYELRR